MGTLVCDHPIVRLIKLEYQGASDQFMNQHLLVKMHQLGVANLGNSFAITCDWRLDLAHFPYAAE